MSVAEVKACWTLLFDPLTAANISRSGVPAVRVRADLSGPELRRCLGSHGARVEQLSAGGGQRAADETWLRWTVMSLLRKLSDC